jgi:uncharacterized protein (TIGR03067 family)
VLPPLEECSGEIDKEKTERFFHAVSGLKKLRDRLGIIDTIRYDVSMNASEQLPGIWQAISTVFSGQELPSRTVETIRLTLTANRFTTQRGTETLFDSVYTTDPSRTPMQIEMIGTGEGFEGKPALGIFALEDETLQLCYRMPGCHRPTEFTSPPGSDTFLIILKRLQ